VEFEYKKRLVGISKEPTNDIKLSRPVAERQVKEFRVLKRSKIWYIVCRKSEF
jgi:hypothetical protein